MNPTIRCACTAIALAAIAQDRGGAQERAPEEERTILRGTHVEVAFDRNVAGACSARRWERDDVALQGRGRGQLTYPVPTAPNVPGLTRSRLAAFDSIPEAHRGPTDSQRRTKPGPRLRRSRSRAAEDEEVGEAYGQRHEGPNCSTATPAGGAREGTASTVRAVSACAQAE